MSWQNSGFRETGTEGPPTIPNVIFKAYANMIDLGVSECSARDMIRRIVESSVDVQDLDLDGVQSLLVDQMTGDIRIAEPLRCTPKHRCIVALVGPPSGGKTTTVAKLAAHFRLRKKRRVGLLAVQSTSNTSNHALHQYAQSIDIPLQVIHDSRAIVDALARLRHAEIVLVDTASVDPTDRDGLHQLADVLQRLEADTVQLVLNAGGNIASLFDSVARFAEIGASAMILTQLDLLPNKGRLVELFRKVHLPVSYLAAGDNLMNDIRPATTHDLAETMLGLTTKNRTTMASSDVKHAVSNKVSKRVQLSIGPGR